MTSVQRYVNRRGQVYDLHAGKTKTGKPRYFVAKVVGEGALGELPAGFEIVESVNGGCGSFRSTVSDTCCTA